MHNVKIGQAQKDHPKAVQLTIYNSKFIQLNVNAINVQSLLLLALPENIQLTIACFIKQELQTNHVYHLYKF